MTKTDDILKLMQWMMENQNKTTKVLEKLSERINTIESKEVVVPDTEWKKTMEDMVNKLWEGKVRYKKIYKVMIVKGVLPMAAIDQQMHWDNFANGWINRGDTNKRFDSEKEAKEYWESVAPGKYKLLPVTMPMSEWAEFKRRTPNLSM